MSRKPFPDFNPYTQTKCFCDHYPDQPEGWCFVCWSGGGKCPHCGKKIK